jgi:F1F0 ATPase subunit 2
LAADRRGTDIIFATIDVGSIAAAFIAGLVLGIAYFLALWATVRRLAKSKHPMLMLLGTGSLRIVALGAGLVLIGDGQWERMLAVLAAFIAVRLVATRWLGTGARQAPPA